MKPTAYSIKGKSKRIFPNQILSQQEFEKEIKKAENGEFITVEESMKLFDEWMKLREKK